MKKPKAPRLVTIAITTTITVIFWIFFTLYQVLTTKPSPSVEPNLLEPIDPTLNTAVLDKISEREYFEEGSFIPVEVLQPPEPQPESQPTEEVIPEENTQTPVASEESQTNQ